MFAPAYMGRKRWAQTNNRFYNTDHESKRFFLNGKSFSGTQSHADKEKAQDCVLGFFKLPSPRVTGWTEHSPAVSPHA
jgi:hypothetical protein